MRAARFDQITRADYAAIAATIATIGILTLGWRLR